MHATRFVRVGMLSFAAVMMMLSLSAGVTEADGEEARLVYDVVLENLGGDNWPQDNDELIGYDFKPNEMSLHDWVVVKCVPR